jgi:uncharacterized RDD family membrane protein YckC
MNTIKISTTQNIDIDFEIAGLAERIWARMIDIGIFIAIFFLYLALGIGGIGGSKLHFVMVVIIIIAMVYPFVMEVFFNGQSIGKKALKIKVISLDGERPTLGQYAIRWIARLIDFTVTGGAVGLVLVAITDKNQRLGDLLANTSVVKTQPRTTFEDLYFTQPTEETYEPVFSEAQNLSTEDVYLMNEVLKTYRKTFNIELVNKLEIKMRIKYQITNDKKTQTGFLTTILKDYNHFQSNLAD